MSRSSGKLRSGDPNRQTFPGAASMKRTTIEILLGLAALIGLGPTAAPADETTYTRQQDLTKPETGRPAGARADRPPRKVVVGPAIFGPYGKYPGLDERLKVLGGLIDEMAQQAGAKYP